MVPDSNMLSPGGAEAENDLPKDHMTACMLQLSVVAHKVPRHMMSHWRAFATHENNAIGRRQRGQRCASCGGRLQPHLCKYNLMQQSAKVS